MKRRRILLGFLLAPIAPALFFGLSITLYTSVYGMFASTVTASQFFFVALMWFLTSIIFSYVCVLIIGIPGYYLLNKFKVSGQFSYMFIGSALGLLLPIATLPFDKGHDGIFGIEAWVYVLSAIFGFLSATTFWLIAVRVTPPNPAFERDCAKARSPSI